MTNPKENDRELEGGPHLRYVEVYSLSGDPPQPVSVKRLRWNGSTFEPWGNDSPIGDTTTASKVSVSQKLWIAWNASANAWYPVEGLGAESFRICRAVVKGAVTPQANTFTVDGILPRAGGLDPSAGDPDFELLVFKDPSDTWHEDLYDNEEVVILYAPGVFTDCDWELLFVERFREIEFEVKGAVSTGDSTFVVDHVGALLSGRDPSDPTDPTDEITVYNVHSQSFEDNEKWTAVWKCSAGRWEARKKSSSGGGQLFLAKVYTEIDAATLDGDDIEPGEGEVKYYARPATPGDPWVFIDVAQDAYNNGFDPITVGSLVWLDDEGYVVSQFCSPVPDE